VLMNAYNLRFCVIQFVLFISVHNLLRNSAGEQDPDSKPTGHSIKYTNLASTWVVIDPSVYIGSTVIEFLNYSYKTRTLIDILFLK